MSDERSSRVSSQRPAGQRAGDGRRNRRDDDVPAVTNGEPSGTNGEPTRMRARLRRADRRALVVGWLAIAALAVAFTIVNALTTLSDADGLKVWEPWVWEISSALTLLVLGWIPWVTTAVAPPSDLRDGGPRLIARFGIVHLLGVLAYSAPHVMGFVAIRQGVYDLMNYAPYEFGDWGDRFIYELRKDALSYILFAAVYWLVGRLRQAREAPLRPVSFDIRDGGRIIRAPLDEIAAVSSAGNYVEFWLSDGRRPLMRATLAAIEVELGAYGFVRAHRSWLVNAARVTALEPDGSGDWTVELGAVRAPLSRRFPEALARLKG